MSRIRILRCLLCALMPAVALAGAEAQAPMLPDRLSDQSVIGTVGRERVTYAEVVGAGKASFDSLASEHQRQLEHLEADYSQAYYHAVEAQLNALLDRRALELEAAARHSSTDAVLAGLKVPAVTDDEARAYYEARKERVNNQPFEQLKPAILEYLADQKRASATRAFYGGLRTRHHVSAALPPYRVSVAATGPVRGPTAAAVTIVEFADFQCPFCQRAEPVVRAVLGAHPDDVRLVFRNLPLSDLHPDAALAARAGVCADQQDHFWPMHDAMFADQSALSAAGLSANAGRLGLDTQRFTACLNDEAATAEVLRLDAQAAAQLGLDSTPYFFVNGRPARGFMTNEQLEGMVSAEIQASRPQR